mgnify:CR=1 FL=1
MSLVVGSLANMIFSSEHTNMPIFIVWIQSEMHSHQFDVNSVDTNVDHPELIISVGGDIIIIKLLQSHALDIIECLSQLVAFHVKFAKDIFETGTISSLNSCYDL